MSELHNKNIKEVKTLPAPVAIKAEVPMTDAAAATVLSGREKLTKILEGDDKRLIVITGPCSIHCKEIAIDYAKRVKELADKVADKIFVVMRVYFEKPRTTVGWKGLINDPYLDGTYDLEQGLKSAREVLLTVNELGMPAATELLDPIVPQYIADLISWTAIGARTTESQTHREMSSGLSMPVGFKNGTDGNVMTAVNAVVSAYNPQHFLGIDQDGQTSIISTKGNPEGHLVLRGGSDGPNYDSASVKAAAAALEKAGMKPNVIVDCSHANSNKDHSRQPIVLEDIVNQIADGETAIRGVMLESNINEGNQSIPADLSELKHGVSLTDKCINWETTEKIILDAYAKL